MIWGYPHFRNLHIASLFILKDQASASAVQIHPETLINTAIFQWLRRLSQAVSGTTVAQIIKICWKTWIFHRHILAYVFCDILRMGQSSNGLTISLTQNVLMSSWEHQILPLGFSHIPHWSHISHRSRAHQESVRDQLQDLPIVLLTELCGPWSLSATDWRTGYGN